MPTAGSRVEGKCKACGVKLVFIYSAAGKWIPCESGVVKVDGARVLVFADGVTGRTHQQCTVGHESHFANCPQGEEFKRAKKAEEKVKAAVINCGCMSGGE